MSERGKLKGNLAIGSQCGRLQILAGPIYLPKKRGGSAPHWECLCSCGARKFVNHYLLARGTTVSCGCYGIEARATSVRKHGDSRTKDRPAATEWVAWLSMRERCGNPKNKEYRNYGGRGISVCSEWRNSYDAFLRDMGRKPSVDHSLDRIDPDGDYSPENCRWATRQEQARNKRSTVRLTVEGTTLTIPEWSRLTHLSESTIRTRLRNGWSDERAVRTQLLGTGKHGGFLSRLLSPVGTESRTDELIARSAFLRSLRREYETINLEEPTALNRELIRIGRLIEDRRLEATPDAT